MDLEFKTFDQLTHSALACSVTSGTSGRARTCRHVARSAIFTKPADLVTVFSPTSSDIANYHKVVKQINQFQKFHLEPSRFMSSWNWYKEEVQLNARGHLIQYLIWEWCILQSQNGIRLDRNMSENIRNRTSGRNILQVEMTKQLLRYQQYMPKYQP